MAFPRARVDLSVLHAPPSGPGPEDAEPHAPRAARARWKPSWLTLTIVTMALGALGAGLYPMTAQWVSAYNQSRIIVDYTRTLQTLDPSAEEQLAVAERYNDALSAGAVLPVNGHVPEGQGALSTDAPGYLQTLGGSEHAVMGRVRLVTIGVDLPMYHGTSERTLQRGAGHLEGSHLPIGGEGRHAVVTAHRGLANAAMFTRLNEVRVGETFTVEVLGNVLSYRVRQTKVVAPENTDTIRPEAGADLVTLVTCTPLGVNSHRILVTGERVLPTPQHDIARAGQESEIPGFAWWALWGLLGLGAITAYLVRNGRVDARLGARRSAHRRRTARVAARGRPGGEGSEVREVRVP